MPSELGPYPGASLALAGSAVTLLSTSAGAMPALATRRISARAQDALMGFSAGIMLAATCFSLLVPSLQLAAAAERAKTLSGVAVALAGVNYSLKQSLFVAFLTGVIEALAALLGFAATLQVQGLLPWVLAF